MLKMLQIKLAKEKVERGTIMPYGRVVQGVALELQCTNMIVFMYQKVMSGRGTKTC